MKVTAAEIVEKNNKMEKFAPTQYIKDQIHIVQV